MCRTFLPVLLLCFWQKVESSDMDEYTKLIRSEVRVRLEKLRFLGDANVTEPELQCSFTLHRGHCSSPAITTTETIAWNTRICFLWKCLTPEHAMRVESCWAGSKHNPVFLLTRQGCSSESAMISSPTYDRDMRRASSVGWLAVRQVGVKYLRLSCDIRLCHLCDDNCSLITPPIGCSDYSKSYSEHRDRMFWNTSAEVMDLCYPTPAPVSSSQPPPALTLLSLFAVLLNHFVVRGTITP